MGTIKSKRKIMPQGLRFSVLRRDEFTCRYCGRSSPDVTLHVDHVRAVCDGGTDVIENLVTSCSDCNLGKGRNSGNLPKERITTVANAKAQGQLTAQLGFVGLFGLELQQTSEPEWQRYFDRQFYVERDLPSGKHVVQLFSFFDGRPTVCEIWPTDRIEKCALFAHHADWIKDADRRAELYWNKVRGRRA